MTYEVIWGDAALDDLDKIWWKALDKEGIEQVARRVDTELTYNPTEAGESRHEDFRVLVKHPLVVWYRVLDRLKTVHVLHVRPTKG